MNLTHKFQKNIEGNVALMFAAVMVPLLISIGVAVDLSRLESAKSELQDAADIAVLGAALKYKQEGKKEMRKEGNALLKGNLIKTADLTVSKIKTEKTQTNTIKVTSEAKLKPMFMQAFGYPKMQIAVSSEAALGENVGMELVIAFDNTNSMDFDKRWDTAMKAIDRTLDDIQDLTGKDDFYVSLVPFADRVNISDKRSNWLNGPEPSKWTGCVEPREENKNGFKWSVDDDSPTLEKFTASISGVTGGLSSIACPEVAITGPSKHPQHIITATKKMTKGGTGRFDVGMSWAWRMVSPQWRGFWDVSDYPSTNNLLRKKKIIFVSDGNSNAYKHEMSKEQDWGNNQGSKVAFEHLVDLCDRIKDDGIEIYMMKIDGNPHADSYFQDCASSADHYYKVTEADDIGIAFNDILNELRSELRIIR